MARNKRVVAAAATYTDWRVSRARSKIKSVAQGEGKGNEQLFGGRKRKRWKNGGRRSSVWGNKGETKKRGFEGGGGRGGGDRPDGFVWVPLFRNRVPRFSSCACHEYFNNIYSSARNNRSPSRHAPIFSHVDRRDNFQRMPVVGPKMSESTWSGNTRRRLVIRPDLHEYIFYLY